MCKRAELLGLIPRGISLQSNKVSCLEVLLKSSSEAAKVLEAMQRLIAETLSVTATGSETQRSCLAITGIDKAQRQRSNGKGRVETANQVSRSQERRKLRSKFYCTAIPLFPVIRYKFLVLGNYCSLLTLGDTSFVPAEELYHLQ